MTLPLISQPPYPKSSPSQSRRKKDQLPKRKRGGQPGNSNALKSGLHSSQKPSPLGLVLNTVNSLSNSLRYHLVRPSEVLRQTDPIIENLEKQLGDDDSSLAFDIHMVLIQISKLRERAFVLSSPYVMREYALKTIAGDPFQFFKSSFTLYGVSRDGDSFLPVSKKSVRNSGFSPLHIDPSIPGVPGFATSLTDEQWALLAPLIPLDPYQDYLAGQPPLLIAVNRWGLTRYLPTGDFQDLALMHEHDRVTAQFPALQAPPPARPKKRGRPRNQLSPRSLLDGILWKLATGHNWDDLPAEFPPMRLCRKYYRRLFQSGRFYTLLLALYNHLRLEENIDIYNLYEQGIFITTPSQQIALAPGAAQTSQNYTALLFMQLAREEYSRLDREKKRANRYHPVLPVFKGTGRLSTARLSSSSTLPNFEPLEFSPIAKTFRKFERGQQTIDRLVAAQIKTNIKTKPGKGEQHVE